MTGNNDDDNKNCLKNIANAYMETVDGIHLFLSILIKIPGLAAGNSIDIIFCGAPKLFLPNTKKYMSHRYFAPPSFFFDTQNKNIDMPISYEDYRSKRWTDYGFAGLFSAALSTVCELPIKVVSLVLAIPTFILIEAVKRLAALCLICCCLCACVADQALSEKPTHWKMK